MPIASPIWHPFTQHALQKVLPKVVSGKGSLLTLADGREVIDAISSWWVNIHGHGNEKIAKAIYEQALVLEHVLFAGLTHEPAEELARLLTGEQDKSLTKLFFSDNGSTAVEVALKMAYQYHWNLGELNRHVFIAFEGAYHGDTVGAMSVGGHSLFSEPFTDLLFKVRRVPFPLTADSEESALAALAEALRDDVAGVIVEPLIQGASGMRFCSESFLAKFSKLVKMSGVPLIFDEVMTGFGRTGEWFAYQKIGVAPDLLCLSKGITGGFLPLAVTLTTDKIYDAFLSLDRKKTFYHSHSYTANPLACAAAVASFKLLKENESLFKQMEMRHLKRIELWKQSPHLKNCRIKGTIAAAEVVQGADHYLNPIGAVLGEKLLNRGVLMRPLGNTVYILPPYCITDNELDQVYKAVAESI